MADTRTQPDLTDEHVAPVLQARTRIVQLEGELEEARETYYREVEALTRIAPQAAVAARLGISRQRVSELANRTT